MYIFCWFKIMNDKTLKSSYDKVINDNSFVKLTVFSFLPYSMLFVWYLCYQTYFVISSINSWFNLYELKIYIDKVFVFWEHFFILILIAFVMILILYFFLPPIWEWALINYLDTKKSIWSCMWKWFVNFFKMFELHGFLSLFSFLFFFIVISRIYVFDMLDSTFILPLIFIWLFFVLFFNFTLFYAKYLIVLEWFDVFDSIKESVKLTFLNTKQTIKYFIIYLLLYIRYIINILIVVWIPLLVLYIFLKTDVANIQFVKYAIFFIMFLLFFLVAYVNWIVEAFFIAMWYEIFKNIERE